MALQIVVDDHLVAHGHALFVEPDAHGPDVVPGDDRLVPQDPARQRKLPTVPGDDGVDGVYWLLSTENVLPVSLSQRLVRKPTT